MMYLARCQEQWPDELIADFRQYYGVDLPLDGSEPDDAGRMAVLCSQLPERSRVMGRADPAMMWDASTWLLWRIVRGLPGGDGILSPVEQAERRRHRDNALAARAAIDGRLRAAGLEVPDIG